MYKYILIVDISRYIDGISIDISHTIYRQLFFFSIYRRRKRRRYIAYDISTIVFKDDISIYRYATLIVSVLKPLNTVIYYH